MKHGAQPTEPARVCAGLGDLLPLGNREGERIGCFSDQGSWWGITSRTGREVELVDLRQEDLRYEDLGLELDRLIAFPDRLELRLTDGREVWLGFAAPDLLVLQGFEGVAPELSLSLPVRSALGGEAGSWRLLLGEETRDDSALFEDNRARWDALLARAMEGRAASEPRARLRARAVTTLLWNHRGPTAELSHAGVIPSPFAYRGYWAWDSWKHAHALADLAPELAAEQLCAQFDRQSAEGMVPDAVFPDPGRDHWNCTKPPLAAWALERVVRATGDRDLCAELLPRCVRQMEWFERHRRLEGEVLFRAGGVDHLTATWDTGWDECARFGDVPLIVQDTWKLMDLWQPDYNTYCHNEYRALASLCSLVDQDPSPWKRRAEILGSEIRARLFDDRRGFFCDVRASSGENTGILSAAGWIPVWAGLADTQQTRAVRDLMRSPEAFATHLPLPVLAASEPAFDPDGYWNGSVWADHAVWGLIALGDEAGPLRERFLHHLAGQDSLYECYSPLSGRPTQGHRPAVPQFSWTAAALLALTSTP